MNTQTPGKMNFVSKSNKNQARRLVVLMLIALVAVLLAGGFVYNLVFHYGNQPATLSIENNAPAYTVIANANGGSFSDNATEELGKVYDGDVIYASDYTLPTLEGYTFDGWYTDPVGGTKVDLIDKANLSSVGCDTATPQTQGNVYAH